MFEKIQEIFVDTIGCEKEEVTKDARLIEDLELDSLDMVELSMALEEEFDLSIDDEDLPKFKTVQDILEYIEK